MRLQWRLVGLIALVLAFLATIVVVIVGQVLNVGKGLDAITLPILLLELVGMGVAAKRVCAAYGIRTLVAVMLLGILIPLAGGGFWLAKHPGYLPAMAIQGIHTRALASTRGPAWTETRIDRVVVRYPTQDAGAGEVVAVLPESIAQVEAAFGQLPDGVYVLVFPDRAAAQKGIGYQLPDGFNGAGMDRVTMVMVSPATWSAAERATKPVGPIVTHELTHLAVFAMGGRNVPNWLQEGLGVFVAKQMSPAGQRVLAEQTAAGKRYSLQAINDRFQNLQSLSEVGLGYELAGSVVRFMVDRYAVAGVQQVLAELGAGRSLDQALTAATGMDRNGLEAAWQEWLIATGGQF